MKSRRFENVCANYSLTASDNGIDTSSLRQLARSRGINVTHMTRHQLLDVLCGRRSIAANLPVNEIYPPLLNTPIIEMLIRNGQATHGVPGLTVAVHNILKLYYNASVCYFPRRLWTLEHIAIIDYWFLDVRKYVVHYMMYGNPEHHAMLEAYGRLPSITLYNKPPNIQKQLLDSLDTDDIHLSLLIKEFNRKYTHIHIDAPHADLHFMRDTLTKLIDQIYPSDLLYSNLPISAEGYVDNKYGREGRWTITRENGAKLIINMKNGKPHGNYTDDFCGRCISGRFVNGAIDGQWKIDHTARNIRALYNFSNDVLLTKEVYYDTICLQKICYAPDIVHKYDCKYIAGLKTIEWWTIIGKDGVEGRCIEHNKQGYPAYDTYFDELSGTIIIKCIEEGFVYIFRNKVLICKKFIGSSTNIELNLRFNGRRAVEMFQTKKYYMHLRFLSAETLLRMNFNYNALFAASSILHTSNYWA